MFFLTDEKQILYELMSAKYLILVITAGTVLRLEMII